MRNSGIWVMLLLVFCLIHPGSVSAGEGEKVSTLADQTGVNVTIYNENLALVKDVRTITLPPGIHRLAFREVSAKLRPETALMRSISNPGALRVLEQNFDFDLLTPAKLLEKYVGRRVEIVKTHPTTGEETTVGAQVLSANNGVVLQVGNRIETGIPGRLIFPDVPETLRDRPTLVMEVDSSSGTGQEVELSYLTGGLAWKADYVASLADDEKNLDINGWVTLTNTSGTSFPEARLQLMAGDVNQVQPDMMEMVRGREDLRMKAAGGSAMAEESLFEYHLYTLERPTTIRENQTKQVALLQAAGVSCTKEYLLRGQEYYYQDRSGGSTDKQKVGVFLQFKNSQEAHLGMPLPRGVVRVYKKDSLGNVQFVGEDRIDHTPENEKVRLKLGDAFDVTAERTQTNFSKLSGSGRYNYVFESSFEIVIKNAKKEAVSVRVVEPMPGDWEVLSESHPHTKEAAREAAWLVEVPAKGQSTLSYRVKVRY